MQKLQCSSLKNIKNRFVFQNREKTSDKAETADPKEALIKNLTAQDASIFLTDPKKFKDFVEKVKDPTDKAADFTIAEKIFVQMMTDEPALEKVLNYMTQNESPLKWFIVNKIFKYINPANPDAFFRNVANKFDSDLSLKRLAIKRLYNESERAEETKKVLNQLSTPEYAKKMKGFVDEAKSATPSYGTLHSIGVPLEINFAYTVIRTIKDGGTLNELSTLVQGLQTPSQNKEVQDLFAKQKTELLAFIFDQRQVTRK